MTDALVGYVWNDVIHQKPVRLKIVSAGLLFYTVRIIGDKRPLATYIPKAVLQTYLKTITPTPAAD